MLTFGKQKYGIPDADIDPAVEPAAMDEFEELFKQGFRARLIRDQEDHEAKKDFSVRIFWLVLIWFFVVVAITVVHGFNAWDFALADSVLITLLSTTTANVIGMLIIVLNYLFKRRSEPDVWDKAASSRGWF